MIMSLGSLSTCLLSYFLISTLRDDCLAGWLAGHLKLQQISSSLQVIVDGDSELLLLRLRMASRQSLRLNNLHTVAAVLGVIHNLCNKFFLGKLQHIIMHLRRGLWHMQRQAIFGE